MDVKINAVDTIQIPEGCKAVIKDNVVVFEEEKEKFKDGDILHATTTDGMTIFRNYSDVYNEEFTCYYNDMNLDNIKWNSSVFRHATEEEKHKLFEYMKKRGLLWNDEEKQVEQIRWRANVGEKYYFIDSSLKVQKFEDCWGVTCNEHYSFSNYFHTEEQANKFVRHMKEALCKYHKEIGE